MAQLVEHHLAKVRVAGSNPVVRSELRRGHQLRRPPAVEWPRGEATACKAVYTGSNPVSTSRAISSVGERYLDTVEVTGSIPVSPTARNPRNEHEGGYQALVVAEPPARKRMQPDEPWRYISMPSRTRASPAAPAPVEHPLAAKRA